MKSASPDVQIFFGAGSPLTDITSWILSDLTLGGQGIFVDATPYGATAVVNHPVGMTDDPDLVLEGLFDDADPGPHELFSTISGSATPAYTLQVILTTGSPAKTATKLVHIASYEVLTKVKDVTKFRVTLKAAGPTIFS